MFPLSPFAPRSLLASSLLWAVRLPRQTTSRVSQVPRLIYPHAPPPTTPVSPMAAFTRCFTTDDRLHPLRWTGHSQCSNEVESGSLALRLASLPRKASCRGSLL